MGDSQVAQSGNSAITRRGMLGTAGFAGFGAVIAALAAGCSSGSASSAATGSGSGARRSGSVYYWISHGAPGDQIWVLALRGARQVGKDLGVTVRTSLLNNNLAAQENAITSAIAAGAAGIATTSPQLHVLGPLVAKAKTAGIPVITFNVDDPSSGRVAFVGPNSADVGKLWAEFLVQNKLVKPRSTVFLPVEQVGAAYDRGATRSHRRQAPAARRRRAGEGAAVPAARCAARAGLPGSPAAPPRRGPLTGGRPRRPGPPAARCAAGSGPARPGPAPGTSGPARDRAPMTRDDNPEDTIPASPLMSHATDHITRN